MASIFDIFKEISSGREAKSTAPITHIIVGLGNPGEKYRITRHNAGFLMMDYFAERAGIRVDRSKFKALVGDGEIAGKRVLLMKPQTFMNHSGEAVAEAARFYKIPLENILVFSDDVSLDMGNVRMRKKGSDGGQRGLRSIIEYLSSQEFARVKFGVGAKPHPDYDMAAWVLSTFDAKDMQSISENYPRIYDGLCKMLEGNTEEAMQICNKAKS